MREVREVGDVRRWERCGVSGDDVKDVMDGQ